MVPGRARLKAVPPRAVRKRTFAPAGPDTMTSEIAKDESPSRCKQIPAKG